MIFLAPQCRVFVWCPVLSYLKQKARLICMVKCLLLTGGLAAFTRPLLCHTCCPLCQIHTGPFWFILTDEKCLQEGKLEECLATGSSVFLTVLFKYPGNYTIISSSPWLQVVAPGSTAPNECLSALKLCLHSCTHLWYLHLDRPVVWAENPSGEVRQRNNFYGTLIWKTTLSF